MATNLQIENPVNGTAQSVKDQNGNASSLALSTDKVGIGTTNPTQKLTLGSGNILLPGPKGGEEGNLYFGGITDKGEIGMRLSGGNFGGGQFQCGFIDVRAGNLNDGLRFRVDTDKGAIEQMRITANGKVGIATPDPQYRLEVNGDIGVTNGSVIVKDGDVILTNADCAEDFDICDTEQAEPGTVMVLGDEGKLEQSQRAYDKRVAGVISGAGEYKPGLILDKQQSKSGRKPIALLGKVFCKVDAQFGAIEIGDLLTTAPTPGHAMKVDDPFKAFGTVIGKALRPLEQGQGLIPILIALQ